jgi:hypothetical protein
MLVFATPAVLDVPRLASALVRGLREESRGMTYEGEPEYRAESVIDRITVRDHQQYHKRERLSPYELVQALDFEATILLVMSAQVRRGEPLSDDDQKRLVVACGRIDMISREIAR